MAAGGRLYVERPPPCLSQHVSKSLRTCLPAHRRKTLA